MLHYTLRPVLDWRASIDFLAIAVLLVAVRARPGVATIVGFAVGITSDAMMPSACGAGALAFSVVAYTASSLKAAFFADNIALKPTTTAGVAASQPKSFPISTVPPKKAQ